MRLMIRTFSDVRRRGGVDKHAIVRERRFGKVKPASSLATEIVG